MKGRKRSKSAGREIIGITGANAGTGCTHMACSVANYLVSVEKRKVIYIEVGRISQLYDLMQETPVICEGQAAYLCKGAVYFLSADVREAEETIRNSGKTIVIDFGEYEKAYDGLIRKCGRLWILGSLLPWCTNAFEKVMDEIRKGENDIGQMSVFYSPAAGDAAKFSRRFRTPMRCMPALGDPFSMKEKDIRIVRNLLYG